MSQRTSQQNVVYTLMHTNDTKVSSSPPHAEQIRDADVDQRDQSATSNTLDRSSCDEHTDAVRQCRYERANQEHNVCYHENWLATKDV